MGLFRRSKPRPSGGFFTIPFDNHDPNSEKRIEGTRRSLAGLDYSPLPRITGRSFSMGVLVSMGGMVYVPPFPPSGLQMD